VLSRAEFRLKYAGSVLGYLWSLAKPLMYFTVLWVVFGSLFKPGIERFPLYLLIGIVLYTFMADAVTTTLPSIVSSGPTIRRIAFPPLVIPLASSLAAAMTFLANCVAVAVFLVFGRITPEPRWVLLVPHPRGDPIIAVQVVEPRAQLGKPFFDLGQFRRRRDRRYNRCYRLFITSRHAANVARPAAMPLQPYRDRQTPREGAGDRGKATGR